MSKPVPPHPPGWNKTISDLKAEIKRGERVWMDSPELDWARDYERDQIPADFRFPRRGDIYEALEDMPVHYKTAWTAPLTGGGYGLLKKGERVVVDHAPTDPKPIAVYAKAVDYANLEQRMVSASDRKSPTYGGFYFSFRTVELNLEFRLVHKDCRLVQSVFITQWRLASAADAERQPLTFALKSARNN